MENKELTCTEKIAMISIVIAFTILMAMGFISCTSDNNNNVPKKQTTYQVDNYIRPIEIIVIDSCEYIYGSWGYATVLTHKGNCKNKIHKYEK